ncbi:MAG: c-type cytochrome [Verrucomicrobia bacterium]|nr:c-type cytochrome [Verrucomicrobiota bacterium]
MNQVGGKSKGKNAFFYRLPVDGKLIRLIIVVMVLNVGICSPAFSQENQKTDPTGLKAITAAATKAVKAAKAGQEGDKAEGNVYQRICLACHGDKGQGNLQLRTPSIAGLPDWYVISQLKKFRGRLRGGHEKDLTGIQMHAIAVSLNEEQMKEAAALIAKMPLHATKNTLKGDAAKGMYVYLDQCMECHRYNGSGEVAFRSGQLVGLQDWYMLGQLEKFRRGIRGTDRKDEDGLRMREIASRLRDKDLADVLAYVAQLAEQYVGELNAASGK